MSLLIVNGGIQAAVEDLTNNKEVTTMSNYKPRIEQITKDGNVYLAINEADPLLYDPVDAVSIFELA